MMPCHLSSHVQQFPHMQGLEFSAIKGTKQVIPILFFGISKSLNSVKFDRYNVQYLGILTIKILQLMVILHVDD